MIALALLSISLMPHALLAEVTIQENPEFQRVNVIEDPWQPEEFRDGIVIPAPYRYRPGIDLDGRDREDAWASVEEVTVYLNFGTVRRASIKALYTDEELFLRIRWPDATENREHHPWVWRTELSRYVPGPQVEDSIIVSFEVGCDWFPSLLSGYAFDFDGWQWLAARSDPLGQAVDLTGSISDRQLPSNVAYDARHGFDDWNLRIVDYTNDRFHKTTLELDRQYTLWSPEERVFFSMKPDGDAFVEIARQLPAPLSAPTSPEHRIPRFEPLPLGDHAGDVRAKGAWENGHWTVEFKRSLLTKGGLTWDVQLDRLSQFSIHLFDGVERIDQSSESGRLYLQFLPAEEPPELDFANVEQTTQ